MAVRVASPGFVGRRPELERAGAVLDQARESRSASLLVGGEAGVGKTRFLLEVVTRARSEGFRILLGSCVPVAGDSVPFGPFVEALRGLPEAFSGEQLDGLMGTGRLAMARLMPGIGSADAQARPDNGEGSTFEHVVLFLRRLAQLAPVALCIEDLHWADRSTLELLPFLMRNLETEPVAVIGTFRSDELHRRHPLRPVLAEMERSSAQRLDLRPFDRTELALQLEGILGSEDGLDRVETIFARSGGNPFLAEELVAAETVMSLPETVKDLLLVRFSTLGDRTREVLRMASVAGPHFDVPLLAAVTEWSVAGLYRAIREAVDAQVLVPVGDDGGDRYAFRHALLAEAIYDDLLPGQRPALHRRFATALSEADGPPNARTAAAIAYHWAAAHDNARALDASVRAAIEADKVGAVADARANYVRALELWDQVPDAASSSPLDRVELLVRTALASKSSGFAIQSAYLRQAIDLIDPVGDAGRGGLLRSYLAALGLFWDDAAALAQAREANQVVPSEPPSRARVRVLVTLGTVLGGLDQHTESVSVLREAVDIARRLAAQPTPSSVLEVAGLDFTVPRRLESVALEQLGIAQASLGDPDAGLRELAAAGDIGSELGIESRVAETMFAEAFVLTQAARFEEAAQRALMGADHAWLHGLAGVQGSVSLLYAADALIALGRWTDALQHLQRAERRATEGRALTFIDTRLAGLEAVTGKFPTAGRRLARQRPLAQRSMSPLFLAPYVTAEAEFALWQADPLAARLAIGDAVPRLLAAPDIWVGHIGPVLALGIRAEADLATIARSVGAEDDRQAAIEQGQTLLTTMQTFADEVAMRRPTFSPQAAAWLATCAAEMSRLQGRSDPDLWVAAAAAWARLRMPYPRAYALMHEARALLVSVGGRARARDSVREASEIATGLGARPLLDHLDDLAGRLRLTGSARHPCTSAGFAPRHLDELTTREREILYLMAAGRTDGEIAQQLFISKKTVSVHVHRIKAKLGVTSRLGAARTAMERGLVEMPQVRA